MEDTEQRDSFEEYEIVENIRNAIEDGDKNLKRKEGTIHLRSEKKIKLEGINFFSILPENSDSKSDIIYDDINDKDKTSSDSDAYDITETSELFETSDDEEMSFTRKIFCFFLFFLYVILILKLLSEIDKSYILK